MKLFIIHDSKAETYTNPMCFKTTAEAIRNFSSWCRDTESNLYKFSSDYSMLEIGEFNLSTAEILTHPARIIAHASEFSSQNILPSNEMESKI